ncbi:CDP-alcohol phosphatidyltransferase family protein [Tepidamorphus gemmatus]|uniref:CDP-alcohol phosphatidyltransferase family protein n=1 Tax=Tepidamorphus gemmatus TaxID=747076 RepID=UPI000B064D3C|nr:CDP-alcohol phosphatidyltransferase family protein [Tepidamorphus gemmatus]
MNIPNLITILRLLLVPAVVYLIVTGEILVAFWLFAVAGLSDAVDGFLAKRYGWVTDLGAYLDPLADKALLVSIFVALGILGALPVWLVFLVVSRDLFIVCGVLLSWMLEKPVAMAPLMVSKANTTGQILLAATVLADLGFQLDLAHIRAALVALVGLLTVVSAAAYLVNWIRHMAGGQTTERIHQRGGQQ